MAAGPWTPRYAVLFGLMVLAWAGNYLFVGVGLTSATPLWLATLRAAVGAAGLGLYGLASGGNAPLDRRERWEAAALGLVNTGCFLGLWFVAAPSVPPGETAVVIYTFPLWVSLLSSWGAPLSARSPPWLAIGIGFSGVVLVSEPWANVGAAQAIPLLELAGAALSWAIATVLFQRRFSPSKLRAANGFQMLGGALGLGVAAAVTDPTRLPVPSGDLVAAVLWLGLFGTAFAYAVWFALLGRLPAADLSAYLFLVPVTALALSVAFASEAISAAQGIGVLLVAVGLYAVARPGGPARG